MEPIKNTVNELAPAGTQVPVVQNDKLLLSEKEGALLSVLADPTVLQLDITKICKLAGISRPTYYAAFKNENFRKALEEQTQIVLKRSELPVVHNVLEKAKDPTVKAHHWAQMALRMMGRLDAASQKPAQINVVFTNVIRPKVEREKIIEGEAEVFEEN